MRERSEVAGSADGTLRRNDRMDIGIQHCAKRFYRGWFHAAETFRKSIRAKQHHGARFRFAERFANTAAMRAHQIHLQLANLFAGNAHAGEFAKTGVDSVGGFARGDKLIDNAARSVHSFGSDARESDWRVLQCDRIKLLEREIVSVQLNHGFWSRHADSFRV